MFDSVIRGGTVATASDVFAADIGVRNGRIAQIGRAMPDARQVIDATGRSVLPGGIDSHVHLAQPQPRVIEMADGVERGTRSALIGDDTTVMPFCLEREGLVKGTGTGRTHRLAWCGCGPPGKGD